MAFIKCRKLLFILGSSLLFLSSFTLGTRPNSPGNPPVGTETASLGGDGKPSTSQTGPKPQYKYTLQPNGVPDHILNRGVEFLKKFKLASREERRKDIWGKIGDKPLQKWEIVQAWSKLEENWKSNKNKIGNLKRDLGLKANARVEDFQASDAMPFNADSVSAKKAVREKHYSVDKGKLTFEMMIDYDKDNDVVRGVYVAANVHSSDYSNPTPPRNGAKGFYPASKPDIQKDEEGMIKQILAEFPEFDGATVAVVRDKALLKSGLSDPRGAQAKGYHGEMRFVRHVKDTGLLKKMKPSDAMAIIADKNYCAGGKKNNCNTVLNSKELERLKVKLPGKPSIYVNPNWKDPEKHEVEAKVIQVGRVRLEDVKTDPSKAFENLEIAAGLPRASSAKCG